MRAVLVFGCAGLHELEMEHVGRAVHAVDAGDRDGLLDGQDALLELALHHPRSLCGGFGPRRSPGKAQECEGPPKFTVVGLMGCGVVGLSGCWAARVKLGE